MNNQRLIPTMGCTRAHLGFFPEERASRQEAATSSELGEGRTQHARCARLVRQLSLHRPARL